LCKETIVQAVCETTAFLENTPTNNKKERGNKLREKKYIYTKQPTTG